jgi:hypothetical protein
MLRVAASYHSGLGPLLYYTEFQHPVASKHYTLIFLFNVAMLTITPWLIMVMKLESNLGACCDHPQESVHLLNLLLCISSYKQTSSSSWVRERAIPTELRRLSTKLVPTFANRGPLLFHFCHSLITIHFLFCGLWISVWSYYHCYFYLLCWYICKYRPPLWSSGQSSCYRSGGPGSIPGATRCSEN